MQTSFWKLSSQSLGRPLRTFVFFIFFYLYLLVKVDLRLIYHGGIIITNFPIFYRGGVFLRQFLSYPGGPVEYLSAFLSQFFYIGWAGALVVTAQAWLLCVCTDYFLKALNASLLRCVRFLPAILVLITYTQYTYHFVTITALLVSLLFACLYLRLAPKDRLLAFVFFLLLSVILYYVAGGAYLLFTVLCAIYEVFFSRRWRIALAFLFSAPAIAYVGGFLISGVSIAEAFTELLPCSDKILAHEARRRFIEAIYMLYLLVPLTALALAFWHIFVESKVKKKLHSKFLKAAAKTPSWYTGKPVLRWSLKSCLVLTIAGTAFFYHDNELKTVLEADYYAYNGMWPEVLAAYRRHPNSFFVVHAVNRALYHTGRLGGDMFSYNQHPDTLFLTSASHILAQWKKADVYIELGVMNMGESALVESVERLGERPMILKRLALVNMVKGRLPTARVYLGALSKTLFDSEWAGHYLSFLQSEQSLLADEQVRLLKERMMESDYSFASYSPEKILLLLLEKNRKNQMAFEYLMAWYLLTRELEKFAQNLWRLDDFEYLGIPRHYEEAVLIYEVLTGSKVDIGGRRISPQTYERARGFSDISNRLRGSSQLTVMRATIRDYSDSYFFYYNFGELGIAK
ncbi:MAG: DUF6057 family protein [Planctomycetota bacterium]|jgi:hypothetical protein